MLHKELAKGCQVLASPSPGPPGEGSSWRPPQGCRGRVSRALNLGHLRAAVSPVTVASPRLSLNPRRPLPAPLLAKCSPERGRHQWKGAEMAELCLPEEAAPARPPREPRAGAHFHISLC